MLWKWSEKKQQIADNFFKDSGRKNDDSALFWTNCFSKIAKVEGYIDKLNFEVFNFAISWVEFFVTLSICSCLYENDTLKISHSES